MHEQVIDRQQLSENLPLPGWYTRMMTISGTTIAAALPEMASKTGEKYGVIQRNVLPEPWDVPDHIGNFFEGGLYTVAAFSLFATMLSRRAEGEPNSNIRKAAVGAFAVSSAIQVLGEKYADIAGFNTADMTDAAYGVGFAAFAAIVCGVGYKKAHESDIKHAEYYQKQDYLSASALGPRIPAVARYNPSARQINPEHRKKARKQQQASRKKNRK